MSNHRYTNFLLNSYHGRISQQPYLSPLSADNEVLAFRNGNPGAYYCLHDSSHIMPAIGRHSTMGPLQMQPEQACNDLYSTASHQHTIPTVQNSKPAFPSSPVALSAYTNIRNPFIAVPSPSEMSSPSLMDGPAARQSLTTSDPSKIRRTNPSFITFRSNGSTRYRCECLYETKRKSDLERHREGSKHAWKKYHCSFLNCTKSYTRKCNLQEHERSHF